MGSLPSRLLSLLKIPPPVELGLGKLCTVFIGGCGGGMPCDSQPGVKTIEDVRVGRMEGDALLVAGTSLDE